MEFSAVNTMWVLIGAALIFFMKAGFAMLETGLTRAKNAGNIIMKNITDFSIGTIVFWLLGFGLMFGEGNGFIGWLDPMAQGNYSNITPNGVPLFAFLILQTVFCSTVAAIVSGAMAERTKFISCCIYSAVISLLVYPVSGHWIWGEGWLSKLGFHDFAGGTAIHIVGGVAALIGAAILGPRIGKYGKDGKPKAIQGHSLTLAALGVFILWFCWFGFNSASSVKIEGDAMATASKIFINTNLSAAFATIAVVIITWIRYKKPDVSITLNGSLAGLVAITAGCDTVSPLSASIIGILAGFVVVFGIECVDKIFKIDDPVGAIGVHGMCGIFGTLAVGFLSDGTGTKTAGLFLGGGAKLLGIQAVGVLAVIIWVCVMMGIIFTVLKKTVGLRASVHEEIVGLDYEEHGIASSYADFMPSILASDSTEECYPRGSFAMERAVVVKNAPIINNSTKTEKTADGHKLKKICIICKQNKFEELKSALNNIGVTGITVTQVLGFGAQKGHTEYYRGIERQDVMLLPKIKIEVVVCKVPVDLVIETARQTLYTGNIGDGKIFVYDVVDVVRVRTCEQGYDALQDMEGE